MIVAPACGFTRPLTVATSVSVPGPPSAMLPDAFVAIVGCAGATTTFSFGVVARTRDRSVVRIAAVGRDPAIRARVVGVNAGDVTGPPATG